MTTFHPKDLNLQYNDTAHILLLLRRNPNALKREKRKKEIVHEPPTTQPFLFYIGFFWFLDIFPVFVIIDILELFELI